MERLGNKRYQDKDDADRDEYLERLKRIGAERELGVEYTDFVKDSNSELDRAIKASQNFDYDDEFARIQEETDAQFDRLNKMIDGKIAGIEQGRTPVQKQAPVTSKIPDLTPATQPEIAAFEPEIPGFESASKQGQVIAFEPKISSAAERDKTNESEESLSAIVRRVGLKTAAIAITKGAAKEIKLKAGESINGIFDKVAKAKEKFQNVGKNVLSTIEEKADKKFERTWSPNGMFTARNLGKAAMLAISLTGAVTMISAVGAHVGESQADIEESKRDAQNGNPQSAYHEVDESDRLTELESEDFNIPTADGHVIELTTAGAASHSEDATKSIESTKTENQKEATAEVATQTDAKEISTEEDTAVEEKDDKQEADNNKSEKEGYTKFTWNDTKVTYYCPCAKCCGKSDGITKSGTVATEGRTIAVDSSLIPLGTEVVVTINGESHTYIAEDTGGAIGQHRIDIFRNSHQDCLNKGVNLNAKIEFYVKNDSEAIAENEEYTEDHPGTVTAYVYKSKSES